MKTQGKEDFRILARSAAHEVSLQELSDRELNEVAGGTVVPNKTASVTASYNNGSGDVTADIDQL